MRSNWPREKSVFGSSKEVLSEQLCGSIVRQRIGEERLHQQHHIDDHFEELIRETVRYLFLCELRKRLKGYNIRRRKDGIGTV